MGSYNNAIILISEEPIWLCAMSTGSCKDVTVPIDEKPIKC